MHLNGNPPRIPTLLVDDEPEHLALFRSLIQAPSLPELDVDVAADGPTALEMLRKRRFQIVLTDLIMPGMDGMELLRRILAEYPETIVIMLTSAADLRGAVRAMRQGAFSYFSKGQDLDEMHAEIRKAIDLLKLRSEVDIPAPPSPILREETVKTSPQPPSSLKGVRLMAENTHIQNVLHHVHGNKAHAARILGITYRQLLNRVKAFDS